MNEIVSNVGDHAGAVWRALHEQGSLSEQELLRLAHLTEQQLHAAVGWLARENKIIKANDTYALGETNLAATIGKAAGKVWRALDIWGEVDVVSLSRLTRIMEHDVFSAMGWLAREGKIEKASTTDEENKIILCLK
jgi:hypothetical protein